MFRSMILLLCTAVLGIAAAGDLGAPFPKDRISLEQWQQFRAEILAKPGIEQREAANQLVLVSASEGAVYIFTQPQHPAYPAVVIRTILTHDGIAELKRIGYYAGNKSAFSKWWREFDEVDVGGAG